MTARFDRIWAKASRANLAASIGLLRARRNPPLPRRHPQHPSHDQLPAVADGEPRRGAWGSEG